MDNRKIAAKVIVGTFGVMIGLAFMKAGGGRILDGLEAFSQKVVENIQDA